MTLTGNVGQLYAVGLYAPGWRPLLIELRDALEALPHEVHVDQVKEKFGGLRFYFTLTGAGDVPVEEDAAWRERFDAVEALVDAAEARSLEVCFLCGATDGIHEGEGYWTRYFCARHDTADLNRERWIEEKP